MNQDFTNIEEIEAYWNGSLTGSKLEVFEQKMKDDPDFAMEVNLFEDMVKSIGLSAEQRIKEKTQSIESKLESEDFFKSQLNNQTKIVKMTKNESNKSTSKKWLSIAATVALLVAAGFYFLQSSTNNGSVNPKLAFEKHFKPENKNLPNILDRLEAKGLANADGTPEDTLATALKLYEAGKYKEARTALSTFLDAYPDDNSAKFYMGISQLQLGEYAKASKHLMPLTTNDNFEQQDMAKWYLALAYSMFGTDTGIENAKKIFKGLAADSGSEYAEGATDYLKMLN